MNCFTNIIDYAKQTVTIDLLFEAGGNEIENDDYNVDTRNTNDDQYSISGPH